MGTHKEVEYSCCTVCNLRHLHRAVNTNNAQLLEELVLDKKHIANVITGWSQGNPINVLQKIALKNSTTLLQALFPDKGWTKGSKNRLMTGN